MGLLPSCPGAFLASVLLVLLSEARGDCGPPKFFHYAEIKQDSKQSYPVGTRLTYSCIPGYGLTSETQPVTECLGNSKWSEVSVSCRGRRCPIPDIENGRIVEDSELRLDDVITFACNEGYRLVGRKKAQCVLKDGGINWDTVPPLCKRIPCLPPPEIANGVHNGQDNYVFASVVTYKCNSPFSLIGGKTIVCIFDQDLNGMWNGSAPECKVVTCRTPEVPNGVMKTSYRPSYTYRDRIVFACKSGFKLKDNRGVSSCGADSRWQPPLPECVLDIRPTASSGGDGKNDTSAGFCGIPSNPPGTKERVFESLHIFPVWTVLEYECDKGYKHIPGTNNFIYCGFKLKWSEPEVFCTESCPSPPNVTGAELKREYQPTDIFLVGSTVYYDCIEGFKRVPSTDNSVCCAPGFKWLQRETFCEAVQCEDPVIEHGVKLTGFRDTHKYGTNIAFECNVGYFMIGSYLIQCGKDYMWNPKVPSCEKITAKVCGAPLVPSGSVHPLKPQYELGTYVVIECNPQYSFPDETVEMTTICQGNNLWKPPAQPCMFTTSSDTSALTIRNGRIVHGEKEKYKPGDNVTVKCYAGYTLQGPSVVRYIGGKKWNPRIPFCSLSLFFILLIAVLIFFILLVAAKRVYQIYSEERGSTIWP